MDSELSNYIKAVAIDELRCTPLGAKLENAIQIFQAVQAYAQAFEEKKNEYGMTGIKALTLTAFAVLQKIADGKLPASFTEQDWKDIAVYAVDSAVLKSDTAYSVLIFSMYEKYIRHAIAQIQDVVLPDAVVKITHLADELHIKTEALRFGGETEAAITEDCLWICLEAMIKLLACTVSLTGSTHAADFAQALTAYCFEYGRLMLFKQEQQILSELIESQNQLDSDLDAKYQEFLDALSIEAEQFYSFVDNAFAPDFRTAFLQSALLAKSIGVKETEILQTLSDVDSFFLN